MKTMTRVVGALMALFLFGVIGVAGAQEETAMVETVPDAAATVTPIVIHVDGSEVPAASGIELDQLIDVVIVAVLAVIAFWTTRRNGATAGMAYYQDSLKKADATPNDLDNLLIRTVIYLQGYTIEKLPDGSYKVTPPTSTAAPE